MLVDFTQFVFENYKKKNFREIAIKELMDILPSDLKDEEFAYKLLRLMKYEEIHLANNITVNLMLHVVCKNDVKVNFTPSEIKVIETLVKANGGVVSCEELIEKVWGFAEDNSILKVVICKIRKKIDLPIICIKGKGYKIEEGT